MGMGMGHQWIMELMGLMGQQRDLARLDLTLGWIIVFNSAPDRAANRNPADGCIKSH